MSDQQLNAVDEHREQREDHVWIHVGFESVNNDDHDDSPHMRQRIQGIIEKELPHCLVIHLACNTWECLTHCTRERPHTAVISAALPVEDGEPLKVVVRRLLGQKIQVIILYKADRPELEIEQELLNLGSIKFAHIEELKKELIPLLPAEREKP